MVDRQTECKTPSVCRLWQYERRYFVALNIKKRPFNRGAQRVEKGVNSEKRADLHAEKTSRNRAEFRFSRVGAVQRYCPERKAESANAA